MIEEESKRTGERQRERKRERGRELEKERQRTGTRRRAEGLQRKAPARFHGHRVYTPPLPHVTGGICPIPTHSRPPFSHSISFCHCSFSAPCWAHSERDPPAASLAHSSPRFSPFSSFFLLLLLQLLVLRYHLLLLLSPFVVLSFLVSSCLRQISRVIVRTTWRDDQRRLRWTVLRRARRVVRYPLRTDIPPISFTKLSAPLIISLSACYYRCVLCSCTDEPVQ